MEKLRARSPQMPRARSLRVRTQVCQNPEPKCPPSYWKLLSSEESRGVLSCGNFAKLSKEWGLIVEDGKMTERGNHALLLKEKIVPAF
ncbi:unnamed protein product [Rangifer tarandus platyrhynchus]|uniref:Uncharacterized protein n=1 Tax=Rangifer tarandus platyrhynchus TaxID=3082113 RepID=A0ABN8Z5R3_RANTA|nr:unnamed protein product [Rangifer tarandus platyrhynchus]